MKNQVLTIEQMQELKDLGVDINNASMCWLKFGDGNDVLPYSKTFKDCYGKNTIPSVIIPTFTLQDILDMFPNYTIAYQGKSFGLIKISVSWVDDELNLPQYHIEEDENLLNSVFKMIKWCKENNYI